MKKIDFKSYFLLEAPELPADSGASLGPLSPIGDSGPNANLGGTTTGTDPLDSGSGLSSMRPSGGSFSNNSSSDLLGGQSGLNDPLGNQQNTSGQTQRSVLKIDSVWDLLDMYSKPDNPKKEANKKPKQHEFKPKYLKGSP